MAKVFAQMRLIAGVLALAFVVATAMPAAAQQPNSVIATGFPCRDSPLISPAKRSLLPASR